MGLLETRLATLSDGVEASQRRFAWAPFPARAAKPEPLEPEWGTCAWPPSRIDAYSSLIPATRREASRTYRKYEVPNNVVTQNDWHPPRRVENPRPKSGRSPVRSRPWPPRILAVQRPNRPLNSRNCAGRLPFCTYLRVFLPPCRSVISPATWLSVLASRAKDVSSIIGLNFCRVIALAKVNSFRPSGPWMRPKPDWPTPPNGSAGTPAKDTTELIDVIPERTRRAMSTPFFLAKT